MSDFVQRAARILAAARHVCVSSGAGMSAESGVPTFRDGDGLWSKFNPAELATPAAFQRDPRKVWEWYRLRRRALTTVQPHDGHRVLAAWERCLTELSLITQNVDGLHHTAGSVSVVELHGRLDRAPCTGCEQVVNGLDDLGPDPRCEKCGARLRPGVVWFGESLPPGAFEQAVVAAEDCDAFVIIGTSGVVQPAASLTEIAAGRGAMVIEINPSETLLSGLAEVSIRSGCRDALVAIDAALTCRAVSPGEGGRNNAGV